jgi:hypothetical protein
MTKQCALFVNLMTLVERWQKTRRKVCQFKNGAVPLNVRALWMMRMEGIAVILEGFVLSAFIHNTNFIFILLKLLNLLFALL